MILNDKQIKKLVKEEEMINPFVDKSIAQGISHGLNSFGYDLRCSDEFKIFTNIKGATADPLLKMIKPPNNTKIIIIGNNQYFFLTRKNSQNSNIKFIKLKLILHTCFIICFLFPVTIRVTFF